MAWNCRYRVQSRTNTHNNFVHHLSHALHESESNCGVRQHESNWNLINKCYLGASVCLLHMSENAKEMWIELNPRLQVLKRTAYQVKLNSSIKFKTHEAFCSIYVVKSSKTELSRRSFSCTFIFLSVRIANIDLARIRYRTDIDAWQNKMLNLHQLNQHFAVATHSSQFLMTVDVT